MNLLNTVLGRTVSLAYDIAIGEDAIVNFTRTISSTVGLIDADRPMTKNDLLYDVVEVVAKIVNYFLSVDPHLIEDLSPISDYSFGGHERDKLNYKRPRPKRKLRAKALYDFVRYEEHELGFMKNSIITLLNCKDEHCWVGELNGKIGWFPAKFVQVLDERTKSYSCAGDDTVSRIISSMIRANLCPVIERVFLFGMKTKFLGQVHPWYFVKDATADMIDSEHATIMGRLLLCKTFKLEDNRKVLSPEESLFRSVHLIELSHKYLSPDVKFRSLICSGLNEQALHLWIEILCSCERTVENWYHEWSFIRSPGWVQIKCDLRILSKLPFNLNTSSRKTRDESSLKNDIRDMLLKYHLFSWDV